MTGSFDPDRFLRAQLPVREEVRSQLQAGRKRTHWMWFVFPQLAGLGSSSMARYYALDSIDDARLYLAHAVLGPRLVALTAVVLGVQGRSIHQIFGSPDDLKFHASMTLFSRADPAEPAFSTAHSKYFGGAPHEPTVEMARRPSQD